MAVRLTQDNKRGGKNGVFDPAHNDHGKAEMMGGLWFRWTMYDNDEAAKVLPDIDFVNPDFSAAERLFYDEYCTAGLDRQNAEHIKGGHKNRCRTMDEYRTARATCPESTEYYLGDMANHESEDTLLQVVADFVAWRNERFPLVYMIDIAGHTEEGAPHMVDRHAWMAHDEDGNLIVCQEKSLEEMGVPRADEAKYQADMAEAAKLDDPKERRKKISQINRFNNRKMTYTRECREKLVEIAKSYGVEIITEPRKPGKNSISQAQHILDDTRTQQAAATEQLAKTQKQLTAEQEQLAAVCRARDAAHLDAQAWEGKVKQLHTAHTSLQTALQGDLRTYQAQEARQGAAALLAALGASVRPQEAPTPDKMAAINRGIQTAPHDKDAMSAWEQLQALLARDNAQTAHGPHSVEGPTM